MAQATCLVLLSRMKLTELDLNLLVVFAAVDECRSVSRAAERLGLPQPAVSRALGRLRAAFDDELFVRAAGAMQPTAKAIQLAPGVRAALANLKEVLAGAAPFSPSGEARTFCIASTDYTTLVVLPPLLERLAKEAPNVAIRVIGYDKGDIPDLIDRGEIDLAIGVFQDAPPRAIRKLLCSERFVGVCRPSHPLLTQQGTMSLQAYTAASHALVTLRRDARGEIDLALAKLGLSRRIDLTLPHMLALPAIIGSSDLVCAIPERAARAFPGAGLQIFDLPFHVPPWRIQMLWNAGARADKGHIWLRAAVSASV